MQYTIDPLSRELTQIGGEIEENLRQANYIELVKAHRVLQYLVLPSFGNYVSVDIFRNSDNSLIAAQTTWRYDLDALAFLNPRARIKYPNPFSPSMEAKEIETAPEPLQTMLDRLAALQLPLGVNVPTMGIDGTRYEIAFGHKPPSCRLCYWHELPDSWSQLSPHLKPLQQLATPGE